MDPFLMAQLLEEIRTLDELRVLEDMFEKKGFTKEVIEAAIEGAKKELIQQIRTREVAKKPPKGLTREQQMQWCVDNGGHYDSERMFIFTCARCPFEADIGF